jgi:YVTN family beta-propeller protein
MAVRLQAGIESITTYGVMLLAVGIVIAVILVLSTLPQSTIPTSCNLYGNLHCLDLAYSANAAAGGSNLVILLQMGVTGAVNVSSFKATVGGTKSTSGFCSTTGNALGPTKVLQGSEMVCIANFPTIPSSKQTYSGTFNLSANYCATASGTTPCPMSNSYAFAGSWRAQGTSTFSITTTSTSTSTSTNLYNMAIYAYVQGGANTRNISVINTETLVSNTVFIDNGIGPNLDASCIAITPDQTQAYFVYAYEGLYVYNAITGTIYKIPGLHGIYTTPVLSPGAGYLYDIEPDIASTTADFYTINTKTNSITNTISADTRVSAPNPIQQEISPDGSQVYIAVQSESSPAQSGAILTYSTTADQLTDTITESSWPTDLALSPNGNTLYAILQGPSYGLFTLQSISTSTFAITNTITLINDPTNGELERAAPQLSPDGSKLYVALPSEGLFVVNTLTDTSNVVSSLPTGNPGMSAIALSSDGSTAYITAYNYRGGGVFVFNLLSMTESAFIPVSNLASLSGIVLTPDGKYAYVSNGNSNTVTVISTATDTVTNTIGVIDNPNYIAVAGGDFSIEPT